MRNQCNKPGFDLSSSSNRSEITRSQGNPNNLPELFDKKKDTAKCHLQVLVGSKQCFAMGLSHTTHLRCERDRNTETMWNLLIVLKSTEKIAVA